MLNQEKPEEYVLSSNETHTIREFVEKAFKAAGIEGAWYGTGKDEYFYSLYGYGNRGAIKLMTINSKFYRPAEVQLLWGNSNKARFDLAWTPKISFDELVKRMVESDIKRLQ